MVQKNSGLLIVSGVLLFIGGLCLLTSAVFDNSDKDDPIKVETAYTVNGQTQYDRFYADSVRNDTIWNNGLYIVNKNIVNIEFK